MRSFSRPSRILTSAFVLVFLSGCGTFSLGTAIPQIAKTPNEQQIDTLDCKDKARLAASAADVQVGAFLLGLTIIGAPAGFELEKNKQREAYKSCMEGKGYRVIPPDDGPSGSESQLANLTNARFEFPGGWDSKDLLQSMISAGGSVYRLNRSLDSGLVIYSAKLSTIGSANGFIQARIAMQLNALDNSSAKSVVQSTINGFPATQVEVTGNLKTGQKLLLTYFLTFFETSDEVVLVNVWTSASSFQNKKSEFQKILNTISGVSPPASASSRASPIQINVEKSSSLSDSSSGISRLNNLNELLKKGLINQKDYDLKKAEILKSM